MPPLKHEVVGAGSARSDWLTAVILIAVIFTPTFRLFGEIPVRVDDFIIFGIGIVVAMKHLFQLSLPLPDRIELYLIGLLGSILLSTIVSPIRHDFIVTAKEYLDIMRPLKFLIVYHVVRQRNRQKTLCALVKTMAVAIPILLALAFLQLLSSRVMGDSLLVKGLALFADQSPFDDAVAMMIQRPFATFNTPTHLGYLATLVLFLAPMIQRRGIRRMTIVLSFLTLLISVTRTLLFGLPVLLAIWSMTNGDHSIRERLKNTGKSFALTALALIASLAFLPLVSPVAADYTRSMIEDVATGQTQDQYSITTRLDNLALVAVTWETAPLLGVATRALLPPYVDSELIITFHRYGMLGLAMLLAVYPLGYNLARRAARRNRLLSRFVIMCLSITFLYGITQGALINSRMGVIPFLVLGITAPWSGEMRRATFLSRLARHFGAN